VIADVLATLVLLLAAVVSVSLVFAWLLDREGVRRRREHGVIGTEIEIVVADPTPTITSLPRATARRRRR